MLETIPPKDAVKRKEFFMTKLTRTSTKLEQLMVHRDSAIDALFSELDRSVAQVRDSLSAAEVQLKAFSEEEWTGIRKQAERRDESECPICCSAFERTVKAKQARGGMDDYDEDDYDAEPSAASSSHTAAATAVPSYDSIGKREVLLSCSHVFHHSCLLSFERFTIASTALEGGGQGVNETLQKQQKRLEALDAGGEDGDAALLQPPPACLCPLCRSNYQKVWF
jgi:hypothetical protein